MKPYLEHIASPKDSSWVLFDRRLKEIPFEWHYNTEYELTLTLNSRGQRFIGDNISFYDDGDLVFIGPRIPHTWVSTSSVHAGRKHQALVLWFTESFLKTMIEPHVELYSIQRLIEKSSRAVTFSASTRKQARGIICGMLDQTPAMRLTSLLSLLLLLAADKRTSLLTSTSSQTENLPTASEERIGRVVSFLHERYREHISIARLMRIAALSRSSLHRLFKLQTRITISAYLAQLRIGNACALLINSQKSISLIAEEVGYTNLANFNRQFKSIKRKTPREFRAAYSR